MVINSSKAKFKLYKLGNSHSLENIPLSETLCLLILLELGNYYSFHAFNCLTLQCDYCCCISDEKAWHEPISSSWACEEQTTSGSSKFWFHITTAELWEVSSWCVTFYFFFIYPTRCMTRAWSSSTSVAYSWFYSNIFFSLAKPQYKI